MNPKSTGFSTITTQQVESDFKNLTVWTGILMFYLLPLTNTTQHVKVKPHVLLWLQGPRDFSNNKMYDMFVTLTLKKIFEKAGKIQPLLQRKRFQKILNVGCVNRKVSSVPLCTP